MGKKEDEPMHDWESLSHVRWDCEYHVVFVPKYRQKKLYGKFRKKVGEIFRHLCRQRGFPYVNAPLWGGPEATRSAGGASLLKQR